MRVMLWRAVRAVWAYSERLNQNCYERRVDLAEKWRRDAALWRSRGLSNAEAKCAHLAARNERLAEISRKRVERARRGVQLADRELDALAIEVP